ncbi:ankyrin repeat domain-containing protein [Sphingomonas sp.]|uniref:ankyrin repeat domain-containing protein n=1 Tax=Sphingomonas sp. TaxID=28214 RepID=UPI003D6CF671
MNDERVRFNPKISQAIRDRNLPALKELFASEPEQVAAFTPFAGGTWLHYAAREGDSDAVSLLLSLGLDANIGDAREGRAAICDAALGGHEDVVRILLSAGSGLDTSEPVRNPLFSAIVGKSLPVAKLLLSQGINSKVSYNGTSMKNMDAIAFALERGETSIAEEIAFWNSDGNEPAAKALLHQGREVARLNNA